MPLCVIKQSDGFLVNYKKANTLVIIKQKIPFKFVKYKKGYSSVLRAYGPPNSISLNGKAQYRNNDVKPSSKLVAGFSQTNALAFAPHGYLIH